MSAEAVYPQPWQESLQRVYDSVVGNLGLILSLLLLGAMALRAVERCWIKSRARRCSLLDAAGRCRCGYPSIGLPTPRCPECGRVILSKLRTHHLDDSGALQHVASERVGKLQRKHLRDPKMRVAPSDAIEGFVD